MRTDENGQISNTNSEIAVITPNDLELEQYKEKSTKEKVNIYSQKKRKQSKINFLAFGGTDKS